MQGMFRGASTFNQDLSNWDISRVRDFQSTFHSATQFLQDLCVWGAKLHRDILPRNVTNMFASTKCFTEQDPDLTAEPIGPFCVDCN